MRQHWSAITRLAWIVPIAACVVLSLTPQAGAQGTSPFCVVNSIGNLIGCYYETIDYCQQMARGLGGACVVNPGASSRETSSPSTSIADEALKWQEVESNRRSCRRWR
jgi:Protein of unknown function (DUF3551)